MILVNIIEQSLNARQSNVNERLHDMASWDELIELMS